MTVIRSRLQQSNVTCTMASRTNKRCDRSRAAKELLDLLHDKELASGDEVLRLRQQVERWRRFQPRDLVSAYVGA
jgi:hypothetical protein